MSKYITTKELAEMFKVTEMTIYRWRESGLPYLKIGRSVRFDLDEVVNWVNQKHKEKDLRG